MDLTIIAGLIGSINPIVLGSVAGGILIFGGGALYVKHNKSKFIDNTDPLAHSNDFKTLKTEDLEREFGSLTVQTKILDEDESLFFEKNRHENLKADVETTQPSTRLVDEAEVFDSFGKFDQAVESLKKAVEVEKNDKEKIRLKILLSQYTNNKGKTQLEEIIKEYPSLHTKSSFGPDNTISALMSSPIPKSDMVLPKSGKDVKKPFDIFDDLPVLNDPTTIQVNVPQTPKDIFADLPSLKEHSSVSDKVQSHQSSFSADKKPDPVPVSTHDIFEDLPTIQTHVATSSVEPVLPTPVDQFDQFSWSNTGITAQHTDTPSTETIQSPISTPVVNHPLTPVVENSASVPTSVTEDSTEKMLKDLQKDADTIDQANEVNEMEAVDDMQKFWKEFGSMVVDIKSEVEEKNSPSSNVIPEMHTPTLNKEPVVTPVLPVIEEKHVEPTLPSVEPVKVLVPELPNFREVPKIEPTFTPVPVVPIIPVVNEEPIKLAPIVHEQKAESKDKIETKVNAKPFKVWANWIVNIDGQQVFRNHFISLKNPWGNAVSAEELYMGIKKLTGTTPDGKTHPWVLVSVFPLIKE